MTKRDFGGEKIVITAGATREEIDPVRFISNYSSGKMGFAIAGAALSRGAQDVMVIAGTTTAESPAESRFKRVNSAEEMRRAVMKEIEFATVFIAAAVADYRPVRRADDKIKKSGVNLILELEPTPDILLEVSRNRPEGLIVVGFAAETTNVVEHARVKLKRKNLDLIVANDVSQPGSVFGADTNRVTILRADSDETLELPVLPKTEVADKILDEIIAFRRKQ